MEPGRSAPKGQEKKSNTMDNHPRSLGSLVLTVIVVAVVASLALTGVVWAIGVALHLAGLAFRIAVLAAIAAAVWHFVGRRLDRSRY